MAEDIKIACPHCKTMLAVPVEFAGSNVKCTKCKNVFMVPLVEQTGGKKKAAKKKVARRAAGARAGGRRERSDDPDDDDYDEEDDRMPPQKSTGISSNAMATAGIIGAFVLVLILVIYGLSSQNPQSQAGVGSSYGDWVKQGADIRKAEIDDMKGKQDWEQIREDNRQRKNVVEDTRANRERAIQVVAADKAIIEDLKAAFSAGNVPKERVIEFVNGAQPKNDSLWTYRELPATIVYFRVVNWAIAAFAFEFDEKARKNYYPKYPEKKGTGQYEFVEKENRRQFIFREFDRAATTYLNMVAANDDRIPDIDYYMQNQAKYPSSEIAALEFGLSAKNWRILKRDY